ncbi:Type 1 glutamine amidotransferase-like domain-containing protein [Virgibacillus necropolis]|uniref:Type 1 glutamine amidotransferase-like domain-containing protein n=1 Tax=Virgibacillus necropolis TaxID=163877 RepID=UPI00384C1433
MDKHLFLFGGGPPFTSDMANRFVAMTTTNEPISILFVERDGWEEYMSKYTDELRDLGLNEFHILPLPSTPIKEAIDCINNSSGIIINGGDTNLYADYIVDTPLSNAIRKSYVAGVPVAGFSAGALISPEVCIISAKDNEQNEFQQRNGLGLISDVVIAVHFSQWDDECHLREAVNKYKDYMNYAIDEETGIYLENDRLVATEGYGVYRIVEDTLKKIN